MSAKRSYTIVRSNLSFTYSKESPCLVGRLFISRSTSMFNINTSYNKYNCAFRPYVKILSVFCPFKHVTEFGLTLLRSSVKRHNKNHYNNKHFGYCETGVACKCCVIDIDKRSEHLLLMMAVHQQFAF